MRVVFAGLALCCALLAARPLAAATGAAGFSFDQMPGPLAVGLRVVNQYDYSRAYRDAHDMFTGQPTQGERARPVQTLIWYPATTSGTPMHYSDYLALAGSVDRFDLSPAAQSRASVESLRWLVPRTMKPEQFEHVQAQSMRAIVDAPAIAQRFPVVIYAPSFNADAFENADLCEYLASNGYVVIASPSLGARGRDMTADLEGVEAQVGDIEFLIGYARTLPDVDASRIAVMGYSWGGVSEIFAAAKDSRIGALVGLDAGIRFVGKIVAEAKYVDPKRLAAPFLFLQSPMPTKEEIAERHTDDSDDFLLRMKYADVYELTFAALVHYHFSSEHLRFLDTTDKAVFPGDHSLGEIDRTYGALARYVLKFLDARFKGDSAAWASIKGVAPGLPADSVSIAVRPGDGAAPTREALAAELGRRGFADAPAIYAEMKKKDEAFDVAPFDLMTWIGTLQQQNRIGDAIEIGKLFVKLHPEMPGSYVWLANAQIADGQLQAAIDNYREAGKIDPKNPYVVKRIRELETQTRAKHH